MQPIVLYSHGLGPNPWKVALILEELEIPYVTKFVDFSDVKKRPYVNINPNGRLPAIEDHNTNLNLWESGAIIEYLIEKYDTHNKISYGTFPEKYHTKQWLHFQSSGQGPYYGQAGWFRNMHHEKIQSAIDRYTNEIMRVTGVLESVLKGQEWLVGDKITYADLSFIPWQRNALKYAGANMYNGMPHVKAWMDKMEARLAVHKVLVDQEKAIAAEKE